MEKRKQELNADDLVAFNNGQGCFMIQMEQLVTWGERMFKAGIQAVTTQNEGSHTGGSWAGMEYLSTDEACKFLGVKKGTLMHFKRVYHMEYIKAKPNLWPMSELQRVQVERRIRPH